MSDQAVASTLAQHVSEERDHIRGARTAPVTLVEYGDFECPHCGQAHYVLDDLLERMDGVVRLVFRHFPLTQIHPYSQTAAEAAEAAGAQGRFWPMHDLLFENQQALDFESILDYAEALRLDLRRFERDLVDGVHTPRVRSDFIGGVRSGVNGTPTFFINGRRHDEGWDLASLAAAIDQAQAEREGGPQGRWRGRARGRR
jgi:protein-disulfide isomerase